MDPINFKINIIGTIEDEDDDNIDVFVYFPNNEVYVVSVFSTKNLQNLVSRNGSCVCTDMLIIEKINKSEIIKAISTLIEESVFSQSFTKIGLIGEVDSYKNYEDLPYDGNH